MAPRQGGILGGSDERRWCYDERVLRYNIRANHRPYTHRAVSLLLRCLMLFADLGHQTLILWMAPRQGGILG